MPSTALDPVALPRRAPGSFRRGRTSRSASVKRTVVTPPSSVVMAVGFPRPPPSRRRGSRSGRRGARLPRRRGSRGPPSSHVPDAADHVPRVATAGGIEVLGGSSRNTSSGRPTSARATKSRCRSPPDSAANGRRARWVSCHSAARSSSGCGLGCREADGWSASGPAGDQGGRRPGLAADPPAQLVTGGPRIEAEHGHVAAVLVAEPLQDLHRGRLAHAYMPSRPNEPPRRTSNEMPRSTSVVP